MFIQALFLVIGSLPHYEVTVDPAFLEQLEADPPAGLEVPASVSFNGVSGDCFLAFRGGTSLGCAKLSWHISLDDPDLFPCGGHILLNAQFRDASLMRNTLGLYLTRELGFPAPETEFVTLSINNQNIGVYEHVERIDRLFYERNGLSFGPLFKNTDTYGRLSHHFSDTTGLTGNEPKIDSSPYGDQLLELIEACFRDDISSLEVDEVLAAFAVHVVIGDNDGIIKNYYLHKNDDTWHYYPWDRDATFGNTWQGDYESVWVTRGHLGDIGNFGASRGILSVVENMQRFSDLLFNTTEIFENDLPGMIDSIRILIRDDLASDPFYEYSTAQFDSLCDVMVDDIETRGAFLHNMQLPGEIPLVKSISISSCLNMGSTAEVELTLEGEAPSSIACVLSFDGQQEQWTYMEPDRFENGKWGIEIQIPSGTYSANMVFGTVSSASNFPVFYPSWGMRGHHQRPDPSPSARVALAGLSPDLLVQGTPLWCGENLWVLPVTNNSADHQDISFCHFSLGEPAGNVFLPGSILVAPLETFYLTNSMTEASVLYGNANVYGDAGTAYPAGTILELFDPSWNTMHTWQIGDGDSLPVNPVTVIPCEISAAGQSDWIELYNSSEEGIDLSQWYFVDSEKNVSLFPSGTSVPPGGLLLAAENPTSFDESLCRLISLDFGIDSSEDSLFFYSRLGDLVFCLSWNDLWPMEETGIMYLADPQSPFNTAGSWNVSIPPGSPGLLNPGWAHHFNYNRIFLTSQNPGDGLFSFHYETYAPGAEAILYDLAGRRIAGIELPGIYQDDVTADFRGTLPNGIYILYLRSSTGSASTRLTILN